jgi:hypothetical protein
MGDCVMLFCVSARVALAAQVWNEWVQRQKEKKEEKRHKRERREKERHKVGGGGGGDHRRRSRGDGDGDDGAAAGEGEPAGKRARRSHSHDVASTRGDDGSAPAHAADGVMPEVRRQHTDAAGDVAMCGASVDGPGNGGARKQAQRGRSGAGDVEEGEL